jgi:hypothetical protein
MDKLVVEEALTVATGEVVIVLAHVLLGREGSSLLLTETVVHPSLLLMETVVHLVLGEVPMEAHRVLPVLLAALQAHLVHQVLRMATTNLHTSTSHFRISALY